MTLNIEESTAEHYRNRVKVIKDRLPRNYRKVLYTNFPELNTHEGKVLINNVMSFQKTHVGITEALEQIVKGTLKVKGTQELELERAA